MDCSIIDLLQVNLLPKFQIDKIKSKFHRLKNLEANQWQPLDSEQCTLPTEVPTRCRRERTGVTQNPLKTPPRASPDLVAFLTGKFPWNRDQLLKETWKTLYFFVEQREKMRTSVQNLQREPEVIFAEPKRKDSKSRSPSLSPIISLMEHTILTDSPEEKFKGKGLLNVARRSSGAWSTCSFHSAKSSPNVSPAKVLHSPRVEGEYLWFYMFEIVIVLIYLGKI